jgi:hypothetical protein
VVVYYFESVHHIMNSSSFNEGFKEVRVGKPFRYNAYKNMYDVIYYERGRQFAMLYDGDLKSKRIILSEAVFVMESYMTKNIII